MKLIFPLLLLTLDAINAELSFSDANNLFAPSVYKKVLEKNEDNLLISPLSAEIVLALAQSGAGGQTAEELRSSLHLPNDQKEIELAFKSLLPKLKSDKYYSLHTANKLYLRKDFNIKDDFKKVAKEVFYADLENIQFVPEKAKAAETMNKWVEQQTQNKIRDLISPDNLNADTVAILINALYFKGNWTFPFEKYLTKKRKFYRIDKTETEVDTMHFDNDRLTFNYAENEELGAKFLELPFQGEDASMVFVLPNEKDGIDNLEKHIDKVFLSQNFTQEYVNISIPKFKTETTIDFKEVLQKLGVNQAFHPQEANFSGISDKKLHISDAVQKTFIDVNEDGVEAAAATFVGFAEATAIFVHKVPKVPKEFHVDHSFIYYIKVKNLIIFVGRVGAPSH